MRCTFILNNVLNCTVESRTASDINHNTRNKYIFHTEPKTFFSNIHNTFGDKIFIGFCIKNIICPPYAEQPYLFWRLFQLALAEYNGDI